MSYEHNDNAMMVDGTGAEIGDYRPNPYPASQQPAQRPPMIDSSESSKMTPQILLLLLIAGLRRCWKWALPTGLVLGAVAAAVLWFTFPIKYEATAWIQILYNKPYYVFEDQKIAAQQYDQFVNTQFALLRGPFILNKALESPEVIKIPEVMRQKDKVGWLAKNLDLQSKGKSEIITVSMQMENPAAAEIVVNSIVNAYTNSNANELRDWNTKLINQLTLEMNHKKSEAQYLQNDIRSRMKSAAGKGASNAGTTDKGVGGGFKIEDSLKRDYYLADAKLEQLNSEYEAMKSLLNGDLQPPEAILQAAISNDTLLLQLLLERDKLQAERSSYEQFYSADDPKFKTLDSKIASMDKRIQEYQQQLKEKRPGELVAQIRQTMEQSLWEKDLAIKSQKIYVEKLRERTKEQTSEHQDGAADIADVSFQTTQLQRVNAVLDQLSTRIVTLQTERGAPNRINLRQPATAPIEPKTKKRLPFSALGGIAAFLFPFALGVALERMRPRLYHTSQIRAAIPDVIIGEIMEPPVSWIHGNTFRKRLARYRESVHSWCTHLLLSHPFNQCRTLAVASVAGDDGKTFLAIQVAVAMAQMKSGPVLLIDGDMRVGRLHLLFGNEEPGIGLADVLSFRKGIGEAVVLNEKEPNLHLLSAGNLDVSPYELLGDGRFRELLDTLENHYSLIMVVLPPVANAAESLVLAQSVDSVLLCIRQGETILGVMEDVFRKLVNTGSNVDGIVVKDIPYYQMAGKDGGFADKVEQIRLAHLLQYSD